MKNLASKIYSLSFHSVKWITLTLTALLFVGSFLFTCYAENMDSQKVLTKWDHPILSLLGMFLLGGLFLIITRMIVNKSQPNHCKKFLLYITLTWIVILGTILILFSKTTPASDAMSVYAAASVLAEGDTSVIHPTDSYLSYYPQQVGLMAFLEILFRIWNLFGIAMPGYHFIKGIYVLLVCLIVLFQYKSVHLLWENDTVDCLYLLLAGANLPMIMYSSFIYGEIPSFAAFSVGLYFLLCFIKNVLYPTAPKVPSTSSFKNSTLLQGFLAMLFTALSVMLRKNSLILMIAVLIVLLLEWFKNKKNALFLLAVTCAVSAFSILPLVQKGYELRSGNYLKTGVPAMSYFAMGMQEADRGYGWYNGFNFYTYQASGMDTMVTNELSRQAIKERLNYFKANPDYAIHFYWYKHLSQWADGTYASRQATLNTFGGRHPLFWQLYEGRFSPHYIAYCNIYQNILYLGALLFCMAQCFMKQLPSFPIQKGTGSHLTGLPLSIGLIGVIGGFLFHIVWEANSRYIFVYGLLLMPYAARGLSLLTNLFPKAASQNKSS